MEASKPRPEDVFLVDSELAKVPNICGM